jgi:hypothetical protein
MPAIEDDDGNIIGAYRPRRKGAEPPDSPARRAYLAERERSIRETTARLQDRLKENAPNESMPE